MEAAQTTGVAENMTTDELRRYKIEVFLKKNNVITNAAVPSVISNGQPDSCQAYRRRLASEDQIGKILGIYIEITPTNNPYIFCEIKRRKAIKILSVFCKITVFSTSNR